MSKPNPFLKKATGSAQGPASVVPKKRHGLGSFVMGYCDDVMSYMPMPEMWDQGGYEIRDANLCFGLPAPWKRDVTQRILDAVDRLAAE